jgi:hypothetical protein
MGRAAGGLTAAMASMYGLGACCMMMGRERKRAKPGFYSRKKNLPFLDARVFFFFGEPFLDARSISGCFQK